MTSQTMNSTFLTFCLFELALLLTQFKSRDRVRQWQCFEGNKRGQGFDMLNAGGGPELGGLVRLPLPLYRTHA